MQPFTTHTGIAAPMDRADVDTDAIIPKVFLKSIARTGFGRNLFNDWRYVEGDETRPNPDFVLNREGYRDASILLARENFGCGSSREHAAWALTDYGIRCVIAPSFGDIFYNNAQKNGLLPAIVDAADLERLMTEVQARPGVELTVDLPEETIASPGGLAVSFRIGPQAKRRLVEGLDDIGVTLQHAAEIDRYEEALRQRRPWV